MVQQLIALLVIVYFLSKLFWQKKAGKITANEFFFWLFFWLLAAIAILSLKWIDTAVARLGFSGSGIEVLLYLGVAIAFYFIFRLRLRIAKMEKDITRLVRRIAIDDEKK